MTTAQRAVVRGAHQRHIRQCAHPDFVKCLMLRHDLPWRDKTFAELMGGCDCPCHFTANGVQIPYGAWVPPGQSEPVGTLHAIRLERIEEKEEDNGWLL